MYKQDNTSHYDYFDYLDATGEKQQFEPNSDMEFSQFKDIVRREWLESNSKAKAAPAKKRWYFF
jgi:hypothetical protein